MSDNREIKIRQEDNSGLPQLIGDLFSNIIEAFGLILQQKSNNRSQALSLFNSFKKEYLAASRPSLFFGAKSAQEIMAESNEYGLTMMRTLEGEFNKIDFIANLLDQFIQLSSEAPAEFLSAIKSVMSDPKSLEKPAGPNMNFHRSMNDLFNVIDLMKKGKQEEGNGLSDKDKKRKFGENFSK